MSNASSPLSKRTCLPCSGGTPRLKEKEIEPLFQQLGPGWKIHDERQLEKEYNFPDFKHALQFTNIIGNIAEEEGHHPDLYLSWGKVRVILWTHKIHGLSESDFILAAKCDEQFAQLNTDKSF